jgi:hypothetical protein
LREGHGSVIRCDFRRRRGRDWLRRRGDSLWLIARFRVDLPNNLILIPGAADEPSLTVRTAGALHDH